MEPWLLTQLVPKRCSSSEGHDFHSRSALPKANAPDPPPCIDSAIFMLDLPIAIRREVPVHINASRQVRD